MKKFVESVGAFVVITMLVFICVPLLVLLAPAFILGDFIDRIQNKRKLKKLINANNNSIFFIYADYNNYDFKEYFKSKHPKMHCAKIMTHGNKDLLIGHLTKNCKEKSYPRLVKITDDELVEKEHYNSLKHYYKRNKDMDSFLDLIEKSIKNLEATC